MFELLDSSAVAARVCQSAKHANTKTGVHTRRVSTYNLCPVCVYSAVLLLCAGRSNTPASPHGEAGWAAWQQRRRHFFVLTAAGKPVYSRHGDEQALAGVHSWLWIFGRSAVQLCCAGLLLCSLRHTALSFFLVSCAAMGGSGLHVISLATAIPGASHTRGHWMRRLLALPPTLLAVAATVATARVHGRHPGAAECDE